MQRSTTQVLYRYLPDAVFEHEDGFIARVNHISGPRVSDVNRHVLLDELAEALELWRPDQRGIPDPTTNADEYAILEPEEVSWDVYPLTFLCTSPSCGRVRRFFRQDKVVEDTNAAGRLRCTHCNAKMRQLRYVTAHECGRMEPLHTPRCGSCSVPDDMYLEDRGSFRTSEWRCRKCGFSVSTRFTPCNCGMYSRGGGQPYQTGYTARDGRLWYPQTLTIINISGQTYDNLQQHPSRGVAALASWLGDETDLSASLTQLERSGSGSRKSRHEWEEQEKKLVAAGIDAESIAQLKAIQGPADAGVGALVTDAPDDVVVAASRRNMLERAGLYDRKIIDDRLSFEELRQSLTAAERSAADNTANTMERLGIEDISVTQRFPIVVASYGYTRSQREPGRAHLRSYSRPSHYRGRTPIFAVPANTEALLVSFDARAVLGFLESMGLHAGPVPSESRAAKLKLASILAGDSSAGTDTAAGTVRRLVHSGSHALLRALDDGQSGFAESSLAEWIVPDALTAAIYVASYNDFTLGALDTVLRRRIAPWLLQTADAVNRCDNDPMCSHRSVQRPHAACDRCLHLSYGCRTWNADLDRLLLRRFWLWTQQSVAPL